MRRVHEIDEYIIAFLKRAAALYDNPAMMTEDACREAAIELRDDVQAWLAANPAVKRIVDGKGEAPETVITTWSDGRKTEEGSYISYCYAQRGKGNRIALSRAYARVIEAREAAQEKGLSPEGTVIFGYDKVRRRLGMKPLAMNVDQRKHIDYGVI